MKGLSLLPDEEVRRWLFNNRIIKQSDAAPYSMPSLDDGHLVRSGDMMLKDAEDVQRMAYEEGFAAGEKAGFSEGEKKSSVLIDRIENIINELTVYKESFAAEVEEQVVDLAVAIARKLVVEEINTRPEIIVCIVKEALKRLQRIGNIRIKFNPSLHDLFIKMKPELLEIHEDIIFDMDSSVPITGPFVISEIEEVVTDIDSMINNIVEDIKGKNRAADAGNRGEVEEE